MWKLVQHAKHSEKKRSLQIFLEKFMFQKIFASPWMIANTCEYNDYFSLFLVFKVHWSLKNGITNKLNHSLTKTKLLLTSLYMLDRNFMNLFKNNFITTASK